MWPGRVRNARRVNALAAVVVAAVVNAANAMIAMTVVVTAAIGANAESAIELLPDFAGPALGPVRQLPCQRQRNGVPFNAVQFFIPLISPSLPLGRLLLILRHAA